MTDETLMAKLDEVTAAITAATLPPHLRWLDAKALGKSPGFSARHVTERIACRSDFPRPHHHRREMDAVKLLPMRFCVQTPERSRVEPS